MPVQIKIGAKFKSLFTEKKRYKLYYGGRGCFGKGQEVLTKDGYKPIDQIKEGDEVYSYNEMNKQKELRKVVKPHKHETTSNKLITLNLKDGTTIKVTDNHEFYYGGRWLKISDILSIFDEWKNGEK